MLAYRIHTYHTNYTDALVRRRQVGLKRSEAVTSWVASHRLAMGEKKRYRQQKRVRTFRKIT